MNLGYYKLWADIFGDSGDYPDEKIEEQFNLALATLSDREIGILELHYGLNGKEPHSPGEIGEQFGVTRSSIYALRRKALRKLRHPYRSKYLRRRRLAEDLSELRHGIAAMEQDVDALKAELRGLIDGLKLKAGKVASREELVDLTPLKRLDLSTRTQNRLERSGILTMGQLMSTSSAEMLQIRNFGYKCLAEVLGKLASYKIEDRIEDRVYLPYGILDGVGR